MYITKKDILSLFRLRGPALAFAGCCGPALTCVGLCWPVLAVAFEMGWARVTGALTVTRTRTQGHPDP